MLAGTYPAMTMSAKATGAWIGSFFVLALAIFAWYAYVANGMAYGSVFGLPSQTAAASLFRVRALRFLVLALIAETIGVGTIVWQIINDQSRPRRKLAAIGIAVVVSVLTFECLRP
jgi:succinate dehydrogenase hydrophobic anchor subunit